MAKRYLDIRIGYESKAFNGTASLIPFLVRALAFFMMNARESCDFAAKLKGGFSIC